MVTEEGERINLTKAEALKRAEEAGLDLLVVSPNATPPVARILDYGQYRYNKEKKQKDARKKSNQKGNILKELKLTPRIGEHDFMVRVNHAREFLQKGYKIKLSIFFKGREATHKELGHTIIERFLAKIEDLGWAESPNIRPNLLGKVMSIQLIAGKKKSDFKEFTDGNDSVPVVSLEAKPEAPVVAKSEPQADAASI